MIQRPYSLQKTAGWPSNRDCAVIMMECLMEGGYSLDRIRNKASEYGDVTAVRFLNCRDIPFLIAYINSTHKDMDIANLYETTKEAGDEFCSLFVCASGRECETYTKNLKTLQYTRLRGLIPYHSCKCTNLSEAVIESSHFEDIFFEAHSFLRDLDGLHPDEALDELCKIIYAKLHDEEMASDVFTMSYGNAEEYASAIRSLYKEANEYDIRVYALKIPGYKRSRGVFSEPIYLSSNALQKACSLFARYRFSEADIDYKARAFQNAYKPAARSGMGQYFTPIQVIRLIVNCIQPSNTDLIIDPFAGSAHFLSEALSYVEKRNKNNISEFAFYKLHGIEKSERMVRIAMTDMRLHGDGHSNIRCTDALLPFEAYADLVPESFDIVMTNPPFGSVIQKEIYSYLDKFKMINGKKKVPLEVLGLERSMQLLRVGGRIGIVLPESIFVNQSFRYVRNWISRHMKIRGIISLPQNTFSPFGANIKTSILIGSKGCPSEQYHVFTAVVENIGFDSKGDEAEGADWQAVADSFTDFIDREGW